MKIALDCDEVILDTIRAGKAFYLAEIDPSADIPDDLYSSAWPVWGDDAAEAREKWRGFRDTFTHSEYFKTIPPLPGAAEGVRRIKNMGHSIFVLSAAGGDPEIQRSRAEALVRLCGEDAFDDIICIDYFQSKADKLAEMGADVLIDDGLSNISHAIESGMRGILVRVAQNAKLIDDMLAGKSVDIAFWHFDDEHSKLVREKAAIADGWPEITVAVENMQ
ncbi:MAG: hypothetical protein LBT92_00245 [Rickettsiales bacterium]|jgi:FMN phosphatase YigB (HAD superfamily)|nr:hypothetical protein [Rickettsiales bacterium]